MAKNKQNNSTKRQQLLEVWKATEDVAMHFNDLLMGFRLKAIGGVAISSAIVVGANLCKTASHQLIAGFFLALAIIWVLICIADFFYYYRLLAGSVDELLRVEQELGDVYLSHQIEHRVRHGYPGAGATRTTDLSKLHILIDPPRLYPSWPIWIFYGFPFVILFAIGVLFAAEVFGTCSAYEQKTGQCPGCSVDANSPDEEVALRPIN